MIRVTRLGDFSQIGLLLESQCDFLEEEGAKRDDNIKQILYIFSSTNNFKTCFFEVFYSFKGGFELLNFTFMWYFGAFWLHIKIGLFFQMFWSPCRQKSLILWIVLINLFAILKMKLSQLSWSFTYFLHRMAELQSILWKLPKVIRKCVSMDRLQLTIQNLARVFNSRSGCVWAMHLFCYEAKRPNLKLKTQPKITFMLLSPVNFLAPQYELTKPSVVFLFFCVWYCLF